MAARILVVDDDPAVCITVAQILTRAGNDVSTVPSVGSALTLAQHQHFDLLISDLVMPDEDGVTAIRLFKRRFPHMPVIAMSGGARLGAFDTLASAHEAGADELLPKPFGMDSLIAAVETAFLKKSVRDASKLSRLLLD